jgi:hypothetical protein
MRQGTRLVCGLALALFLTTITSVSFAEYPLEDAGLELRERSGRVPEIVPDPHSSAEPGDDDMPNKEATVPTRLDAGTGLGNRRAALSWFQVRWQGMRLQLSQLLKALR